MDIKRLMIFVLIVLSRLPVQAASIELTANCQQAVENGVQVFVGYNASEDFNAVSQLEFVGSAALIGDLPDTFEAGEHTQVFSVLLLNGGEAHWIVDGVGVMNTLTVRDDMDLSDCQSPTEKPATTDIPIELASDCAFIETKDYLNGAFTGHWSQVTSDGIPILLHYGQDLIGSAHQSADPVDYRAVETSCF
jgi:hypothetical protein